MLYIVTGSDHSAVRSKVTSLRSALKKKRPNAEFIKIDNPIEITEDRLEELALSQGLFDRKYIIQLDRVLDTKEALEVVTKIADRIKESDNVFIIVDDLVEQKTLTNLKKYADNVDVFADKEARPASINTFAIADALAKRDRKKLWSLYQKARQQQKEPEEIHGILFWQLKAMMLAKEARSAKEAGLKQFPYRKAKQFCKNYTKQELTHALYQLTDLYHQARRGKGNMDNNLERFILGI